MSDPGFGWPNVFELSGSSELLVEIVEMGEGATIGWLMEGHGETEQRRRFSLVTSVMHRGHVEWVEPTDPAQKLLVTPDGREFLGDQLRRHEEQAAVSRRIVARLQAVLG